MTEHSCTTFLYRKYRCIVMELNYFHEFLALAKHKNFHAAANELGISQPTLTNHIKKLEEELDVSLFDRNTRNIKLNEYGNIFYPYAKSITEMHHNAVQAINIQRRASHVVLTVAMEPHYMVGDILRLFNDYKTTHPNTVLEFSNASEPAIYNFLRSGRCDLAITPQVTTENSEFSSITLREEYAVALVHKDHPLASRESIGIEDLIGESLFIPPARLVLYKLLESAYHSAGFELDASCMGITEMMGLILTKQGLGIMIMSDYAAKKLADESLCIIDIRPKLKWYVNLIYANIHSSPESKDFLDYIQASLIERKNELA